MTEDEARQRIAEIDAKLNWPGEGKPCNRCGRCCIAEQCAISRDLFGERERCPALKMHGNQFACELVANDSLPVAARTMIGELLGIGRGCDAG